MDGREGSGWWVLHAHLVILILIGQRIVLHRKHVEPQCAQFRPRVGVTQQRAADAAEAAFI